MKLYREKDLQDLGFTCFYDKSSNSTPTYYFPSNLTIDGNIDATAVNLKFGGEFHCTGFIRTKKIYSSGSIVVDDFISCQKLYVTGDVTVNGNLFYSPLGINCNNLTVRKGKLDCGNLVGNNIVVNGKVDALEIKAKKLTFNDIVNATSIFIEN